MARRQGANPFPLAPNQPRQSCAILNRTYSDVPGQGMFTKAILYGMNILSLAGFVLMGVGLTLNRQGKVRTPVATPA
jgi:hypothetical protein